MGQGAAWTPFICTYVCLIYKCMYIYVYIYLCIEKMFLQWKRRLKCPLNKKYPVLWPQFGSSTHLTLSSCKELRGWTSRALAPFQGLANSMDQCTGGTVGSVYWRYGGISVLALRLDQCTGGTVRSVYRWYSWIIVLAVRLDQCTGGTVGSVYVLYVLQPNPITGLCTKVYVLYKKF